MSKLEQQKALPRRRPYKSMEEATQALADLLGTEVAIGMRGKQVSKAKPKRKATKAKRK